MSGVGLAFSTETISYDCGNSVFGQLRALTTDYILNRGVSGNFDWPLALICVFSEESVQIVSEFLPVT